MADHLSRGRGDILDLIRSGKEDEAFRECVALASGGFRDAKILLGWMYQTGTGTPRNLDQAREWYERAKRDSRGEAEFYLGTLFRTGHDDVRALEAFQNAARAGYAPAMYHLGRLYLLGDGVQADEEMAFRYFREAAKHGHLFAQRNIARRMISGRDGVLRIPRGVVAMLAVFYRAIRLGWNDPDSELTHRL